jgi:hypothetical protein
METEPVQTISFFQTIMWGGPPSMVAYFLMIASTLLMTVYSSINICRRRPLTHGTAFIPFPAIAGLALTFFVIHHTFPLREVMEGCGPPLATRLADTVKGALFGSFCSLGLYSLALLQAIVHRIVRKATVTAPAC